MRHDLPVRSGHRPTRQPSRPARAPASRTHSKHAPTTSFPPLQAQLPSDRADVPASLGSGIARPTARPRVCAGYGQRCGPAALLGHDPLPVRPPPTPSLSLCTSHAPLCCNLSPQPFPPPLPHLLSPSASCRRLHVRGYICVDHAADAPTAFAELERLLQVPPPPPGRRARDTRRARRRVLPPAFPSNVASSGCAAPHTCGAQQRRASSAAMSTAMWRQPSLSPASAPSVGRAESSRGLRDMRAIARAADARRRRRSHRPVRCTTISTSLLAT